MVRKFFKKLITLTLLFNLLGVSTLSSVSSVVFAEDTTTSSSDTNSSGAKSNTEGVGSDGTALGRTSAYIAFAKGKKLDATTVKDLSTDQLRFLGVYLSNFYTPWMTDLGSGSDKTSKSAEASMADALTNYAGFDKDTAKTLYSYVQGITRASAVNLTIQFKEKQTDKETVYAPSDSKIKGKNVTYADLLLLASGWAYEMKNQDADKSVKEAVLDYVGKDYGKGKYRFAYFGFGEGKDFKPVFGFDTQSKENTASMVSLLKAMEMVDTSKGYGFAALDFKKNEIDVKEDSFAKLLDQLGEKEVKSSSIYGAKLKVSAFGDIIWMGQNHQYVVLPGAMNPFTWQRIDGDGKDYGRAGNALNVANAQMLTHIANGSMGTVSPESGDGTKKGMYNLSPKTSKVFDVGAEDGANLSTQYLRMVVGSSSITSEDFWTNMATALPKWLGGGNSSKDQLFNQMSSEFFKDRGLTSISDNDSDSLGNYKLPFLSYSGDSPVAVVGALALMDSLGAYGSSSDTGDSSEDSYGTTDDPNGEYNLVQKSSIINEDGTGFAKEFGEASIDGVSWGNSYKETKDQGYAKLDTSGTSKATWKYLYVTYLLASLEEGKFAGGDYLDYRINYSSKNQGLPKITGESIKVSASQENDSITKSIRDWLYYLLHPTDGFNYFTTWITNKIKSFMLKWHNDMSGTEGVGVLPGTTKYIGFSGYVTTPELTDMSWTNTMLNWYRSITIYLVIFVFIIMASYTILGILTVQKALLGLVIFSVLVYAPIIVTVSSVNLSNRFANFVFGDKFSYWGIVQQQSYFADLADSIDSSKSSYKNYLVSLYAQNAKESGNQGGDNMVLRWQAPKKMSNLVLSNNEEKTYSDDFTQLIKVATDGRSSSESFSNTSAASYMYRSYTDIANVSMFMYGDFVSNGSARDKVDTVTTSDNTNAWSKSLKDAWSNFSVSYSDDRKNGYSVLDSGNSSDSTQAYRVRLPLAGNIYSDASNPDKQGKIKDLKLGSYWGIDQRMFKFSIAQLNTNQDLIKELQSDGFDPSSGGKYTEEDIKSLAAYGVMSENPFYYFSWDLYDQGLASNASSTGGFKTLLLSKADSGYFYNVENNNEMRDYLDMRTMFTYLIPYLKQGNDLVREWDDTYGVFFYDGVTYEEGHENDPDIAKNPELAQKYWHNVNVARLYNIYTPWVDLMYDSSYAKQEKISYQGKSYTVSDPINPSSYPKERPMVFSKSEMYDYGLTDDQLTSVERKIMNVSEKTMKRWFDLLNYYNFKDVALNTSAAMEATFIFNQEFSQTKLVGTSINLYPQSFELKNFTYDAFLRMIVANSTGESLIADEGENGSIYKRVMDSSSITTGVFMIILDILAIYAIPLLKIAIIVALFVSIALVVLIAALSVNDDIGKKTLSKVAKSVVKPAFTFLAVSVGMSWSVSLFMGRGSTSVTGDTGTSIVLGDPAMTMLAMMSLNIIVFVLYWKVLTSLWKGLKEHGGSIMAHVSSILGGAAIAAVAGLGLGAYGAVKTVQGAGKVIGGAGKAVAGGAKALDDTVGITSGGASRASRRAEQKARQREDRKAWRNAKKETRKERYGSVAGYWNRNSTLNKRFNDEKRDLKRKERRKGRSKDYDYSKKKSKED